MTQPNLQAHNRQMYPNNPNHKTKTKKPWWLWAIVIVAALVVIAAVGSSETPEQKQTEAAQTEAPAKDKFYLGETASRKGVKMTFLSIEESTGTKFNSPDDGKVYLLAEFEIENSSETDVHVSQLSLDAFVDDYAVSYSIGGVILADQSFGGTAAPGKKLKGTLAYEVSEDWEVFELRYKPLASLSEVVFEHSK